MASNQWDRIQAYCKVIWGADRTYDIEAEEQLDEYYFIFVREDRGTSFGNMLAAAGIFRGYAHAWNELERYVARLAQAVETEGWVPKVQPLDVDAYPRM